MVSMWKYAVFYVVCCANHAFFLIQAILPRNYLKSDFRKKKP